MLIHVNSIDKVYSFNHNALIPSNDEFLG